MAQLNVGISIANNDANTFTSSFNNKVNVSLQVSYFTFTSSPEN